MRDLLIIRSDRGDTYIIYMLKGEVVEKQTGFIAIDVNGIAFEVNVSLATYASSPAVGESAKLFIHMVSREDGVSLYGFTTVDEKKVFLHLITVSGIGAKLAMKILGGIGVEQLQRAISHSDHALLATIPGVGKKTAERIVVELKDKFDTIALSVADGSDVRGDVAEALLNLGYKLPDCRRAVENCSPTDDFQTVLKSALQILSGKA